MSNAVTIDILFRYKEAGENFFKSLENSSKNFSENFSEKVIQSINDIGTTCTKTITNINSNLSSISANLQKITGTIDNFSQKFALLCSTDFSPAISQIKGIFANLSSYGEGWWKSWEEKWKKMGTFSKLLSPITIFFHSEQSAIERTSNIIRNLILSLEKFDFVKFLGNLQKLDLRKSFTIKFPESIKSSFLEVNESLGSVSDSLEYIVNLIKKFSLVFSGAMDDAGERLKTQDGILQGITSKILIYVSGVTFWGIQSLRMVANQELTAKQIAKDYFSALPGIAEAGFNGIKTVFSRYKNFFLDTFKILSPSGLMAISEGNNWGKIWNSLFSTFAKFPLFTIFNKLLTGDILELAKRMIGLGNEALSPMGRLARLVTTIDSGVHSTATAASALFKSSIYFSGIFLGFWSPIAAGLGIAKNLMDAILKSLSHYIYNIAGQFGGVRAQINVAFVGFRNFFFQLAKSGGVIEALSKQSIFDKAKMFITGAGTKTLLDRLADFIKSGQMEVFLKNAVDLVNTLDKKIANTVEFIRKSLQEITYYIKNISSAQTGNRVFGSGTAVDEQKAKESLRRLRALGEEQQIIYEKMKVNSKNRVSDLFKKMFSGMEFLTDVPSNLSDSLNNFILRLFSPKAISQATTKSKESIDKQVISLFNFDNLFIGKVASGASLGGLNVPLRNFFKTLETASKQELDKISPEKLQKTFSTFFQNAFAYTGTLSPDPQKIKDFVQYTQILLKKELESAKGTSFGDKLASSIVKGVSGKNPDLATKMALVIEDLQKLLLSSLPAIEKSGTKIATQLGEGIKAGKNIVDNDVKDVVSYFSENFPQSPAKRGPLVNLVKMGEKISLYLAQGIQDGGKHAQKATGDVAEKIAKFFPRSLPQVGALMALPMMGFKIPFYIAKGIASGAGMAYDALQNMVDELKQIFDALINKIKEFRRIGSGAGIPIEALSSLDFALKSLGSSVSDASFAFSRLSEILENPSIEDGEKFRLWGINLDEVRNSANPVLTLFLKLSDVIKDFGSASWSGREAAKAMGLMMQSSLIPAMEKGSSKIEELMQDFSQSGATVRKEMGSYVELKDSIEAAWIGAKEAIVQQFLIPIVPILKERFLELYNVWEENSAKINVSASVIGSAVKSMLDFMLSFVSFSIKEPKKALNTVYKIFSGITEYILSEGAIFADTVGAKVFNFLIEMQVSILAIGFNLVKNLFAYVGKEVAKQIGILETAYSPRNLPVLKQIGDAGQAINKVLYEAKRVIFFDWKEEAAALEKKKEEEKLFAKSKAWGPDSEGFIVGNSDKTKEDIFNYSKEVRDELAKQKKEIDSEGFNVEGLTKSLVSSIKDTIPKVKEEVSKLWKSAGNSVSDVASEENKINAKARWEEFVKTIEIASSEAPKELKKKANAVVDSIDPSKIKEKLSALYAQADQAMNEGNQKLKNSMDGLRQISADMQKEIESVLSGNFFEFVSFEDPIRKAEEYKRTLEAVKNTLGVLGSSADTLGQAFGDMYEATGKKAKEFFYLQKAMAMASAIVSIAQGIAKALEGGIWGIVQGSIISAAGAIQLGIIAAQTISGPSGYAMGGIVNGPEGNDVIPARLTKNEFVQPVDAVNYYGVGIMEALRNRMIPRDYLENLVGAMPSFSRMPKLAYATGGVVSGRTNNERPVEFTVVNITDKQEIADFMASNQGQDMIVNVISSRSQQIKRRLNIKD